MRCDQGGILAASGQVKSGAGGAIVEELATRSDEKLKQVRNVDASTSV